MAKGVRVTLIKNSYQPCYLFPFPLPYPSWCCWKVQWQGHPKEAIWKVIPALLIWSIWKERNGRLFEDSESNVLFENPHF